MFPNYLEFCVFPSYGSFPYWVRLKDIVPGYYSLYCLLEVVQDGNSFKGICDLDTFVFLVYVLFKIRNNFFKKNLHSSHVLFIESLNPTILSCGIQTLSSFLLCSVRQSIHPVTILWKFVSCRVFNSTPGVYSFSRVGIYFYG